MNKRSDPINPQTESHDFDEFGAYDNDEIQMIEDAYYDRPDVIRGEQFQDRLDMYRNEY